MKILDPIHKHIHFSKEEEPFISAAALQRLRHIRQLGFAEFAFPGATHSRFLHSLGAAHLAGRAFDSLDFQGLLSLEKQKSFRRLIRLAALLHDIGHGPFSHISEMLFPPLKDLQIPFSLKDKKQAGKNFDKAALRDSVSPDSVPQDSVPPDHVPPDRRAAERGRSKDTAKNPPDIQARREGGGTQNQQPFPLKQQARHEHWTVKWILSPCFSDLFKSLDLDPRLPAHLIDENVELENEDFFISQGLNFKPLLKQLISSDLDMDRMDYLQRDSFFCGADFGFCDHEWILNNLKIHIQEGSVFLAVSQKAVYSVESFFLGRRHMGLAIYFHSKMTVLDAMLQRWFKEGGSGFSLPLSFEGWLGATDHALFESLRADSTNEWAKGIIENRPYESILEVSYTPAPPSTEPRRQTYPKGRTAAPDALSTKAEGEERLSRAKEKLRALGVPYLHANSAEHVKKLYVSKAARRFPVYIVEADGKKAFPLQTMLPHIFNPKGHVLLMDRLYVPRTEKQGLKNEKPFRGA